jgi:integrase
VTPFTVKQEYERQQKQQEDTQRGKEKVDKLGLKTIVKLADKYTTDKLFGFRPSTQKAVKESINQFKVFLKKTGQLTLERRDLDREIIREYERYLQEKKKLADSTHGKRMKHLRWFLKDIDFDVTGIKIRNFKKQIIVLDTEELAALEGVEVSAEYQKSKDLFLLGCYTGLRISDLKRLSVDNIHNGFIEITLLKNNRKVKIPVIQQAREILDRYEGRPPCVIEQVLNRHIKTVCEKAGMTQRVSVDTMKAGQRISKTFPKHDLISSHTAGKTFISTVGPHRFKLSPAEIAAIVGKDLKTLLNSYFDLPGEEAREKIIAIDRQPKMQAS